MADPLKILLLDDNPDDRALIRRALKQGLSDVRITEILEQTGLDRALEAGDFEVVVTDYQLRWTDGLTVLREVKARFPDRPVIMFTNTGTEEVAVEAMKSGLDDYIIKKSQHFGRLAFAVQNAIERVQAHRRAERLETRLQGLLDRLNVGVVRLTPEGVLLDANPAFLRLLGVSSMQEAASALPAVFSPQEQAVLIAQIRQSGQRQEREIALRRTDGDERWALLNETLTDLPGATVVDAILEDITARKEAERQIRDLNSRLEQAMRETHHRVKNSLQIISALVDVEVMRHPATFPTEKLQRLAQNIRALAAIHDLLTLRAKNDPELEFVPVRGALEKLLPILQEMAHGRYVSLQAQEVLLPVKQSAALAVLVNEIVANSIKHSSGDITITFSISGNAGRLAVADCGVGFSPDFDPKTSGSIGMDLIHAITQWDLRGSVEFRNREEGGAEVIVIFPFQP